jgi:hypothetical protein
MWLRGAVAWVVLLTLVLAPMLGVAADDFSASSRGTHHEAGLRSHPTRGWRTVPAAVDRPAYVPCAMPPAALDAPPPEPSLTLVVRTPFVPPRG